MTSSSERLQKYCEIMADPTLKAEYLAKARKKIADKMKAERDRLFAPRPKDATHYYKDFLPKVLLVYFLQVCKWSCLLLLR